MNITADLFEAHLKCHTKCWLRAAGETGSGNEYAEWVGAQNESYECEAARRLQKTVPETERVVAPTLAENLKNAKWRLATHVPVQIELRRSRGNEAQTSSPQSPMRDSQPNDQSLLTSAATSIESRLHAVERVPSEGRGKPAQFVPIRFISRNKLTADDRLLLAFDALVLSEALGRNTSHGKIIHRDDYNCVRRSRGNEAPSKVGRGKSEVRAEQSLLTSAATQSRVTKVKTSALAGEVRKRIEKIAALLSSPTPPDLVLNRHCAECEFRDRCRKIAIEKDDLSLLAGMSAKERQKLRSKGIFTVTQLSYTFRPRRRPKRLRDKREKYHHSLKALAIREQKIHIVGSPELKIEGTPVYLDVEGLDRDFYYLIGLRIGSGESAIQHSLWADTVADEGKIWREFLAILETVEKPVLIHYGSYETTSIHCMFERYGEPPEGSVAAKAIQVAMNILSVTFAQVYFPTFSNRLKEIAGNLGFRWSDPTATGIVTVVWRQEWEASRVAGAKQALLTYNAEDCAALEAVTRKLLDLHEGSPQAGNPFNGEIVETAKLKWEHPYGFKRNTFAFPELKAINNAAYWDYQRERVYAKSNRSLKHVKRRKASSTKVLRPDKTVECGRPRSCPKCNSPDIFKHTKYSGLSGFPPFREKDIHAFAESRRGRRRRKQSSQPSGFSTNATADGADSQTTNAGT
jgi:hypothetical protein